jgi:hypothetical protein
MPHWKRSIGQPDSGLDRRIGAILAIELQRLGRQQWRLGHEARPRAPMRLGGVHQERVAQVDCAGRSSGGDLRAMGGAGKPVGCELTQGQARFPGWGQLPGNVEM